MKAKVIEEFYYSYPREHIMSSVAQKQLISSLTLFSLTIQVSNSPKDQPKKPATSVLCKTVALSHMWLFNTLNRTSPKQYVQ